MRGTAIRLAAALVGLVLLAGGAWAQEDGGSIVDQTRDTLSQWVETQKAIAKERRDWQLAKEVLEQRVDVLEGEIGQLQERIGETRDALRETNQQRQELIDENDALKDAASSLGTRIIQLEAKTQRLLKALPDPIRDRVRPLSQRIPSDPTNTQASLGERFQNVVGVLNEVNKFNQNVTVLNEIRTLGDGKTAEVQTVYIGLGQAYFVTSDGSVAGYGVPGNDGWDWKQVNELAPKVTQVIQILGDEAIPAYVPLPVKIQ